MHLEHFDRTRQHRLHCASDRSCCSNLCNRHAVREGRDHPASDRVGTEEERVDGGNADERRGHALVERERAFVPEGLQGDVCRALELAGRGELRAGLQDIERVARQHLRHAADRACDETRCGRSGSHGRRRLRRHLGRVHLYRGAREWPEEAGVRLIP